MSKNFDVKQSRRSTDHQPAVREQEPAPVGNQLTGRGDVPVCRDAVIVALLFLVFAVIGADTFIVSPLLPGITWTLEVPVSVGGYLVTAYSAAYVVFSFLLAPVSDRMGRRFMIAGGMLLFAAASVATGLVHRLPAMLCARGLTGMGAACAAPSVWAFVGDHYEPRIRGRVTSIVASALSLGLVLGVPAGTLVMRRFSWQQCFFALGLLALVAAVLLMTVLPAESHRRTRSSRPDLPTESLVHLPVVLTLTVTFLVNAANFGLYTFLGAWLQRGTTGTAAPSGWSSSSQGLAI